MNISFTKIIYTSLVKGWSYTPVFLFCAKDGTKLAQLALFAMVLGMLQWDNISTAGNVCWAGCVPIFVVGPSWGGVVNDGRAPRAYSSVKNFEKGVEISI